MAEASNEFLFIENIAIDFHFSHSLHFPQVCNDLISGNLNFLWDFIGSKGIGDVVIPDFLLRLISKVPVDRRPWRH